MSIEDSKICTTCKGFGHDKGGRPVIKFENLKGTTLKRHITVKQGSGCISCLGTGRK